MARILVKERTHRRKDPELVWRHVAQIGSIEFHRVHRINKIRDNRPFSSGARLGGLRE